MTPTAEPYIRYTLGLLLLLVAANAFGGGYYGMAGAEHIPTDWLRGSPFRSYFIPSLFLFIVVGGACLLAANAVFRKHRLARKAALMCGILLLLWLSVQAAIIGYVSLLQPITAAAALLILLLSWHLPVDTR